MQKKKFMPLTALLLSSLCFGACSCGKPDDTNVIAIVNGKEITAEHIYNSSLYDPIVAGHIYRQLEKALIESSIPATDSMKAVVENEITAFVNKVKNDATLNGTDYEEDLNTALKEEGVESLEELKAQKLFEKQKEAAKTLFLAAKEETYITEFVRNNHLYHVGDITLNVSGSSTTDTDLYSLTISSAEAEKIHDAILELVEGEQYYNVAMAHSSGDSKSKGGEVGIVTLNDNDISKEQRYALIGYSSVVEGKYGDLKTDLGFKTTPYTPTLESFYTAGLETIPLSYIVGLEGNYDKTDCYSDDEDTVYTNSKVYYRNILFNALLNSRTPRYITLTAEEVATYNAQDRVISASELGVTVLVPNEKLGGYVAPEAGNEQYVLVNEDNNPYVVYKDDKGLHIMTIHMTPFTTDYERYFSTDVDSEDGVYIYAEYGDDAEARLEEIKSFGERYITKDYGDNTGNSNLIDYEMFKYYLAQSSKNGNFKIVDKNVEAMINQYMTAAITYSDIHREIAFDEDYDFYTNNILWNVKTLYAKEIPLLSCLQEDSKGNNKCTYKYGQGFSYYTTDAEGGSN